MRLPIPRRSASNASRTACCKQVFLTYKILGHGCTTRSVSLHSEPTCNGKLTRRQTDGSTQSSGAGHKTCFGGVPRIRHTSDAGKPSDEQDVIGPLGRAFQAGSRGTLRLRSVQRSIPCCRSFRFWGRSAPELPPWRQSRVRDRSRSVRCHPSPNPPSSGLFFFPTLSRHRTCRRRNLDGQETADRPER